MNRQKRRLTAALMAAAALILTSCAPGPSADEQAAGQALTAYLAENPTPGATIDDRVGPWEHGSGYAFLLRGTYTSQNGAGSPAADDLAQVYVTTKGSDGWEVAQEASFGPDNGVWTVVLFGGTKVEIDPENAPHRATCYVLEAGKEGDPESCDAITD